MQETLHIVSFSGGKDSTAMLLMMLERGLPVDKIVCCDTGKEFPTMYEHWKKVESYTGRKITILREERSFDYWMFEHIKTKGTRKGKKGYGWPNSLCRWCTKALKQEAL
ncbi:MAG: phosphoadenosine phosphosulfate reductase family protein, partial [Selenomonadaceae bacterium]